jgi:hypothetical protein
VGSVCRASRRAGRPVGTCGRRYLPRFLEPGRFANCRFYSGGLPHGTNANGEAPRWHAGGGASAIEEAERQNAGAHASALRRVGDGDDWKGAAEFASPAQMRASERTLRASRKTRQQGILTFTERTSLIAVYESSGATINPPAIESVSAALPDHVRV